MAARHARKNEIDLDDIDLESDAVLGPDDEFRGVKVLDITNAWNSVKRVLGNASLSRPIILDDPLFPVHFGITVNWNVILNLAACPSNLQGKALLEWLTIFPMHHEIGHYFICPFDGVTNARFGIAVQKAWPTASGTEIMSIINYFSDIIVNNKIYSFIGPPYFDGMKTWTRFVIKSTIEAGYALSASFLSFSRVHEMLWKKKFNAFKALPSNIEDAARRITSAIQLSHSWIEAISLITGVLKDLMIEQSNRDTGQGRDVLSDDMQDEIDDGSSGGNGNDADQADADGKGKNRSVMVTVKKDGKYAQKPYDMTILTGNPSEDKSKGSTDKLEKENDENRALEIIGKEGMPFKSAKKLLEFMHAARDDADAWRLWIRAMATGLFDYKPMTVKRDKGGRNLPASWQWGDPVKRWNVVKSIDRFPPCPIPPFAKGIKPTGRQAGDAKLPDVRDILIVRDSSSSTSVPMDNTNSVYGPLKRLSTVFDVSSVASMAALHAAIDKGARFGVINFSSTALTTGSWLDSSEDNIYKAERLLIHYQGNLTNLPLVEMRKFLDKGRKCFVLVITDSLLSNWDDFFDEIDSFLANKHVFSMIFVKLASTQEEEGIPEGLAEKEISVNVVERADDLIGITLGSLSSIYS